MPNDPVLTRHYEHIRFPAWRRDAGPCLKADLHVKKVGTSCSRAGADAAASSHCLGLGADIGRMSLLIAMSLLRQQMNISGRKCSVMTIAG